MGSGRGERQRRAPWGAPLLHASLALSSFACAPTVATSSIEAAPQAPQTTTSMDTTRSTTNDETSGGPCATAVTAAPRSWAPAYVMGGLNLASLITGGLLIGIAESEHARLVTNAPRGADGTLMCSKAPAPGTATAACDAWRSKTAAVTTEANAAVGLFVAGGVALAGAAAYWFWPTRSQGGTAQNRSWTVMPLVGIGSGGAMWTGNF